MTSKSNPSKAFTMKINRNTSTIEIQWDRRLENTEYILNNLKLFDLESTPKVRSQLMNLSNIGGKKSNTDTIFI